MVHDIDALVSRLPLAAAVRLLTGAGSWRLHGEPAVGLRPLVVSDGPAGVRGTEWDDRDPSVNVPSPTALAASWDAALVERVGGLLAAEARRKGVDVVLAPTVNLHRTPYGGRHFECFSEDPLLTGHLASAYVRGLQSAGTGACVKHFVANDSETDRFTADVVVDERVLRELYLAPFEAVVRDAGAWSVMAAYNAVGGTTMTASPLLRDVLQTEWGFDGVTMSDWFATRSTVETARAGLDLVMPGPDGPWGEDLVRAVEDGRVDRAVVDDKVRRLLVLAARVGALAGTDEVDPTAAAAPTSGQPGPAARSAPDARAEAALVREAAVAGTVLVTNDGTLPLDARTLRRVALLGPDVHSGRTLGGGSATVFPPATVSPVEGLRSALGPEVELVVGRGVRSATRTAPARAPWVLRPDGAPGLEVRLVARDGTVLDTQHRSVGTFNWLEGFGVDGVATVEVRFTVDATSAGTFEVGASGLGRFRVEVDGTPVADDTLRLRPGADVVEAMMAPPQLVHRVEVPEGGRVDVRVVHHVGTSEVVAGDTPLGTVMQVNVEPPHPGDDEGIEHAVRLAASADVAVVVVGTTEEVESEGFDRSDLALPGRQDELVRRVAAVNPRTVVVVNAGSPVLTPWADAVAAVLVVWFPGQELGTALADVLLGTAEPGGRLPVTWPATDVGLPDPVPVDGTLRYDEGLLVGYRGIGRSGRDVRWPFGHGLGWTTWEHGEAQLAPDLTSLRVPVRNTGARAGGDVVQVYAERGTSEVERPVRWLAGWARVTARPGEEVEVTVPLSPRTFEHWDVDARAWRREPGAFDLWTARSSGDLRSRVVGHVPADPAAPHGGPTDLGVIDADPTGRISS
ncbi:glycoside hydrolase family 3 C-terminal domain-containing protein [Actinotalea sp. AC32]|nr:glycoside hydrolase family 3 C-terminal domain-containing protein [Actinotalea sp. AC32]